MFAWFVRLFGRNKEEYNLDIRTDHFTRPSGQWDDQPKVTDIKNKFEKLGERVRVELPSKLTDVKKDHTEKLPSGTEVAVMRDVVNKTVQRNKKVNEMLGRVKTDTERCKAKSPEVQRFQETQKSVDHTRQAMFDNAVRNSTYHNNEDERRRREANDTSTWLLNNAADNYSAPAPSNYHSNSHCSPSYHDNGYHSHSHSCPSPSYDNSSNYDSGSSSSSNWD